MATAAVHGLFLCGVVGFADAQAAHFVGVETMITNSTFSNPGQIAVDEAGNIYVADRGNNRIIKEGAANDGYRQSVIDVNGLNSPLGLAVDLNGNLYVTDGVTNRIVEEIPSRNGYESKVLPIAGLNDPVAIAVDSGGNLYISDAGNSRVVKEALVDGDYIQSTIIADVQGGEIAVDAGGNAIYLAIPGSGQVIMSGTTRGSRQTILANGISKNLGIAVNQAGVVYIADAGNARILRIDRTSSHNMQTSILETPLAMQGYLAISGNDTLYFTDSGGATLHALALSAHDFGSVPVGTKTAKTSLLFSFDSAGSIATPSVVLQGKMGMDFGDAGTGTCTTNGPNYWYSIRDTCTVDLTFNPEGVGWRYGAVVLLSPSGAAIATGYVRGRGTGPQLAYQPGTVKTKMVPGRTRGTILIADAAGNLYLNHSVAKLSPDNAIYKETKSGNNYVQSLVGNNLVYPLSIALDGAGNVYVLDDGVILKFIPNVDGSYSRSIFAVAGPYAIALATDGAGNVYCASSDNIDTGYIQIYSSLGATSEHRRLNTLSRLNALVVDGDQNIYFDLASANGNAVGLFQYTDGTYSEPIGLSSLAANSLAIDGTGDIYAVSGSSMLEKLTTSSGSLLTSNVNVPGAQFAGAPTLDGMGDLYWIDKVTGTVQELDYSDPPALHFSATQPGFVSSDSPQALTVANVGNETFHFPATTSGTNPDLPEGFVVVDSGSPQCLVQTENSSTTRALAAGASCQYEVSYSPLKSSDTGGWMFLADKGVNHTLYPYTIQPVALIVDDARPTALVNWNTPSDISYGTGLSVKQLSATATIPGSFAYIPPEGTVLTVGLHTLSAIFTRNDSAELSTITTTVPVTVTPSTPSIQWATPSAITYGTLLSSMQLNASSSVAGSFIYTPTAGTLLTAGLQTLSVTFIPNDTTDYRTATATVMLTVNRAVPTIYWYSPTAIVFGTFLNSEQLDATASVPGSFVYSPGSGTVPAVGSDTLSVTFTPIDTTDYTIATQSVILTVNEPIPTIASLSPAEATAGGVGFTLTIFGTGYTSASTVSREGTPLTIQSVSPTQITVQVPASAIVSAGTDAITVQNPAPGGGTSNQFQFAVVSAGSGTPPSFTALAATVAPGAAASYPVTLTSSATNVSVSCLNLPAGATCSYSASTGAVTIATTSTTPAGNYQITVVFTETVPSTSLAIPIVFLLLLPLMFVRRRLQKSHLWLAVSLGISIGFVALVTGCGGSSGSGGSSNVQLTTAAAVTLTVQ